MFNDNRVIYLSIYLPIYVSIYLPIYVSIYLPIYVSIYAYLSMPIYLCLSIYAYLSMPIYLCLSIYAYLSMPIYLNLSIYAYLSQPIYLCLSIYASRFLSMPIYLSIYVILIFIYRLGPFWSVIFPHIFSKLLGNNGLVMDDEMQLDGCIVSAIFDSKLDIGVVGTSCGTVWYINWDERSSIRLISGHKDQVFFNMISSQGHAVYGTSCLLAFLDPTTRHILTLRSINLIWFSSPLSLSFSSSFLCWGFVYWPPWSFPLALLVQCTCDCAIRMNQ